MSNQRKRVDFSIGSFLSFCFFSPPSCNISVSNISSWDWCVIDYTINLTLCILPPMSNKDRTAIYHWIRPITPPFTVVPLVRDCVGPPVSADHLHPFLAKPGMAQGWWFVQQTGFGTLRWSSLLQNAPQLMERDTTVTTWPSKAPLNSPAVLPCVTYGSRYIFSTANVLNIYCDKMLCFFEGLTFYCSAALIAASPSTTGSSCVA